jgi:hypothetical protein
MSRFRVSSNRMDAMATTLTLSSTHSKQPSVTEQDAIWGVLPAKSIFPRDVSVDMPLNYDAMDQSPHNRYGGGGGGGNGGNGNGNAYAGNSGNGGNHADDHGGEYQRGGYGSSQRGGYRNDQRGGYRNDQRGSHGSDQRDGGHSMSIRHCL